MNIYSNVSTHYLYSNFQNIANSPLISPNQSLSLWFTVLLQILDQNSVASSGLGAVVVIFFKTSEKSSLVRLKKLVILEFFAAFVVSSCLASSWLIFAV